MAPPIPLAVLGLACDRGAWPEVATATEAALGTPVLGPLGLLGVVEAALGLGRPDAPAAARLAVWRAALEAAGPDRFWDQSLAADPIATAAVLLARRDGLVAAGWTGAAAIGPAARLADLAAAEQAAAGLPPGLADRLAAATLALADADAAPIAALRLLDPLNALPTGLARLVGALAAAGTEVSDLAEPASPALGDLGKVQDALRSGAQSSLGGDGSVALLTAETETAAAEVLADWLAAGGAEGRTVVIADRPTAALDGALARRHLPRLGVSRASAQRGALQLLPLAFAARWRPFDARRTLELLEARPSPVPREVGRALAAALTEAPGRGGPPWVAALAKGLDQLTARLAREEREDPGRPAAPRLRRARDRVAALLETPLADPEAGMPAEEVRALCGLLAAWAAERGRGEDPLLAALAGAARDLAEAVRTGGRDRLPRVELERLLATALEPGLPDPGAREEAAVWTLLRDPGALWDFADTVVWWGLGAPSLPARSPWTRAERAALAASGCTLAAPAPLLAGLERAWRRPLLFARRRALLVAVPDPGEADARRHPVLDGLRQMLAEPPIAVRPVAERLLGDPSAALLGTPLRRVPLAPVALPAARARWEIPPAAVPARATESASSIETLLGCAYAWVGRYAAGLREGRAAEIPEGSQLIGSLAHRLAQEVFAPGAPPEPGAARATAEARLPALLEAMAAPLLAPGAAAELARVRADLPRAMAALAKLLRERGLAVTATEAPLTAPDVPEAGQTLVGAVDMLLSRPDGRPVVIDLKWSGTDRYRRAEIAEGRAVQLAAYVGLAGAGEDAAFFMLAQRRVLALPGSTFGGEAAPSLRDTWDRALAGRRRRLATIADGTLRAIGVGWDDNSPPKDPDDAPLAARPPCRHCAYSRLCGQEALR